MFSLIIPQTLIFKTTIFPKFHPTWERLFGLPNPTKMNELDKNIDTIDLFLVLSFRKGKSK